MALLVSHLRDDEGELVARGTGRHRPSRGTHDGLGAALTDLTET
ncbi:hypothetical protein [Streptomyces blattellae]|nr:hypothetical protein [Streptomyces blattellae]